MTTSRHVAPPSKLTDTFAACRAEHRAALIGYLPVGYPTVANSLESMRIMVESGCDIVEVGVPYSDPVMDGPTIHAAADTALAAGVRVRDAFAACEAVAAAGEGDPMRGAEMLTELSDRLANRSKAA